MRLARPFFSAAVLLLLAVTVACHRNGEPSLEYERANQTYLGLLNDRGDEAALDPRADEVLALCARVPADSLDADAAQRLAARIGTARTEHAALEQRMRKAAEVVADPNPPPSLPPVFPADAAPNAVPGAPQATALPLVGSPSDVFLKRYGGCVYAAAPFVEKGGTRQGQAYALANSPCGTQFPELKGKMVAVADGRIFNVVDQAAAGSVEATPGPDGKLVPLAQDGGVFPTAPEKNLPASGLPQKPGPAPAKYDGPPRTQPPGEPHTPAQD